MSKWVDKNKEWTWKFHTVKLWLVEHVLFVVDGIEVVAVERTRPSHVVNAAAEATQVHQIRLALALSLAYVVVVHARHKALIEFVYGERESIGPRCAVSIRVQRFKKIRVRCALELVEIRRKQTIVFCAWRARGTFRLGGAIRIAAVHCVEHFDRLDIYPAVSLGQNARLEVRVGRVPSIGRQQLT